MQPQSLSLIGTSSSKSDGSIGRIVSVTGAKAVLMLDSNLDTAARAARDASQRPEMGTLLAIETESNFVLAIVSALSMPVPAQRDGDLEIWIAELGLVGELKKAPDGRPIAFNRGVTAYPSLGDRARVAHKHELEIAFGGDPKTSVRVGTIRQDSSIPAMIRVDDLLGKHFAILGTTGTGKSCTTALILRAILERNPAAHVVLLDPHNEYATAFAEWGEVISPRNMQLPYWLLNFEELIEVVVGNANDRKAEVELLQELIPIAKARYGTGRTRDSHGHSSMRQRAIDPSRFTVDTPVPYRISDLTALLDDRMGKLENKRDIAPCRNLKTRLETLTFDPRYAFMFGSVTVYDGMAQILGRIFRVPVNNKPITILELTGLPTEIVSVVVSVLCRMTFDFALWSEGKVPVTVVCEEAHRYVPANPALGFEPCKRAIAKIAKEGRKYGASLCIVTQRPAEIDPTILSQCNTIFALRMSNDRDQEIVTSSISDTGSGLLEFLSALGQREAIAFGEGVALPVRIRFDELPKHAMPRSSSARFSEAWQKSVGDEGFLEQLVERWRSASAGVTSEQSTQVAMLADAMGIASQDSAAASPPSPMPHQPSQHPPGFGARGPLPPGHAPAAPHYSDAARMRTPPSAAPPAQAAGTPTLRPDSPLLRRDGTSPAPTSSPSTAEQSSTTRLLRERLLKQTNPR